MLRITGKTTVIGIFGYPVEHSLSPLMHNTAFKHLNIDYCYVPFPVHPDKVGEAVAAIRALRLRGVNVTIPHKQAVIPFLDEISPEARIIGAVNTIVNRDGALKGYNTDGQGFVRSLREDAGMDPAGKTVILLGAGGSARGVGVQLALAGAKKVYLVNRTPEKAEEIAKVIADNTKAQAEVLPWTKEALEQALGTAQIIVNTTSIGMFPYYASVPPVITALLRPGILVADLVYNPVETGFLTAAAEKGCATLSGLGMLLYQGAIAFELWTGQPAPVTAMQEVLRGCIENRIC